MKTKLQRCYDRVNGEFSNRLAAAFAEKFGGIAIETRFNFFSMQLVSSRADDKKFTKEQHSWIGAYSEGYAEAMNQIEEDK